MLSNPYLPSPSASKAWAEGFTKGFAAIASPEPSENIAAVDIEAFNEGVYAGSESAVSGLSLNENPCIPALEEEREHSAIHFLTPSAEIAHGLWEMRHLKTLGAGIIGILIGLVEVSCSATVHTKDPNKVMPKLGQLMIDALISYGMESMELFCGAGLDAGSEDCEICMTPLFSSFDQARQAAIDMNRQDWIVVSWRTDQSNSFRVVDSN